MTTTRTRTKVSNTDLNPYYYRLYRVKSNGVVALDQRVDYSMRTLESTSTITDVVTPEFKKKSAAGEIINNPLTITSTVIRKSPPLPMNFQISSRYDGPKGSPVTVDEYIIGAFRDLSVENLLASSHPLPSSLKDLAVAQLYANMSNAQTMALATLGEAEETVATIVDLLRSAVKLLRDLRRRDLRSMSRRLKPKEIREKYLIWRYGLRPLAFEIKNTINAYNASLVKRRKRFSGYEERKYSESADFSMDYSCVNRHFHQTVDSVYTARAGALVDVSPTPISVWGIDQIMESTWELIPFSFIIDWFINVGTTIAAWTPNIGVQVLASWVTVTEKVTQKTSRTGCTITYTDDTWISAAMMPGDHWTEKIRYSRTRYVEPQRVAYPQFRVKLDSLKILDLVAIFSQFRR